MDDRLRLLLSQTLDAVPDVVPLLSADTVDAIKAKPLTRDEWERKLARLILAVDRRYLRALEEATGFLPLNFWADYQSDLKKQIATPLRQYIVQSFDNYSDYVNFIDKAEAVANIDTAMTRAIEEVVTGIANNTRSNYEAFVSQGLDREEIIERIALRFSSGHAEQVAVTELTRAEGHFSEALSARLNEQGASNQIRWLTSEDEKVCPICAPLDHVLKKDGGWMTKHGLITAPPAHPNCRCKTVVELTRRQPNATN